MVLFEAKVRRGYGALQSIWLCVCVCDIIYKKSNLLTLGTNCNNYRAWWRLKCPFIIVVGILHYFPFLRCCVQIRYWVVVNISSLHVLSNSKFVLFIFLTVMTVNTSTVKSITTQDAVIGLCSQRQSQSQIMIIFHTVEWQAHPTLNWWVTPGKKCSQVYFSLSRAK